MYGNYVVLLSGVHIVIHMQYFVGAASLINKIKKTNDIVANFNLKNKIK